MRGPARRARAAVVLLALMITPSVAFAHEGAALAPHDLLRAWTWEPGVLIGLAVIAAWYGAGVRRLWRVAGRGRVVGARAVCIFACGLLTLFAALLSPLDALSDALFSAHMVQHLLLILVAAPLLVLGAPLLPMLWAFPAPARRRLGRWWAKQTVARAVIGVMTEPLAAWGLHLAALCFWHLPAPYGWALGNRAVHALEHATFLATAVLFWWAVVQPSGRRRLSHGASVLYVSLAGVVMGALGAVITFSPSPWYIGHAASTVAWGLTPLQDQQLAGLIMWIPASLVYLVAACMSFVAWLGMDMDDEAPAAPAEPVALVLERTTPAVRPGRRARGRHAAITRLLCVVAIGGAFSTSACSNARGEPEQMVAGGSAARGQREIEKYGCGTCHMIPGVRDADGTVGPPLVAFGRRSYIAGEAANTPDALIRWIQLPQSIEPLTQMPALGVSAQEARDMAAYLETLR